MAEISSRAVLQVLDGLERLGLAPERVARAAGLDPVQLSNKDLMISWDQFVDLFEEAERRGLRAGDFEVIGESVPQLPSAGGIIRVARFVITPRQLYEVTCRWICPTLFPFVRVRRRALDKDVLEISLEIPPGRRGCESFLRVNLGVTRVVPTLVGYPRATIDADVGSHSARFRIYLPRRARLTERLRVHALALLSPGALIRELGRQQAVIADRFEALIRARRDFRHVIERIPDVVLVCRSGNVIYANPASKRVLELVDRSNPRPHLLDLVQDDDRGAAARHLATTEAPSGSAPTLLRFTLPSGNPVLLEVAPVQRIDFEGKPALLVVARDVTESQSLKDQLARADRLSSLGSLVATVGHELSNPIGCISLNLGILERAISRSGHPEGGERALEALHAALHGANLAREILRELTTFSRGTESRESLAVHEPVKAAIELAGKEVELRAELLADYRPAPPIRANRGRLEQVIVNLLLNAAQSFRDGERNGHRVTVRTRAADGESVLIEVEDNGAGMDEATCAQIFEPFFSTKPAGEGTGLGLAICRDIIKDMGGEIDVESSVGSGSRFQIRLPAVAACPEDAEDETPPTCESVDAHRRKGMGGAKARVPAS